LGRELFWDEVRTLEDRVQDDWTEAGRFDDLIAHALREFETQDGLTFCATLGLKLARLDDRARIERLFLGLAKSREAAFWRVWPKAEEGHIGAMRDASLFMATALEAMRELHICYSLLGYDAGKPSVKAEMLRLQSRIRPRRAPRK